MHHSSYHHVQRLAQAHVRPLRQSGPIHVLDVGSADVNGHEVPDIGGSFRPIFDNCAMYTGVDMAPGKNVDVVQEDPYRLPFPDQSFDAVVSGSCLEHCEFFWLLWLEVRRVLKPGGVAILIVPSWGWEHRFPVDCWRFYADGMEALAKWAKMDLLESGRDTIDWENDTDEQVNYKKWGDCWAAFRARELTDGEATLLRRATLAMRLLA